MAEMTSNTGLDSVLSAVAGVGTSYFNSEQAAKTNKANAKQQLALAGQQSAAQKTVLVVGVLAVVLVVIAVIFAKRS